MPNDSIGTKKTSNGDHKNPPRWLPYVVIASSALAGVGIIWTLCYNFIPLEKDRVEIFLAVTVNYLILMGMFVQAYITNRQWKAMREQQGIMADTLRHTREIERPILAVTAVEGTVAKTHPINPKVTVTNKGRTPNNEPADRDIVLLSGIELNFESEIDTAMRPVFDSLWNVFGNSHCMAYGAKNGRYNFEK